MIMENLIVYLIGLIAVLFVARKAYKTLSGKSGCSCGCGGNGKKKEISSSGCGCGCGGNKQDFIRVMTDEYSVFDGFTAKVAKVWVDLGYFYKAIGAYFILVRNTLVPYILQRKGEIYMFNVNKEKVKSANLFAAGLALGTVGLKMLTSKDAKKVYANVVAAGLRAKESVMQTAEKVQASSGSILADAQEINENRRKEEALFEEEQGEEKGE